QALSEVPAPILIRRPAQVQTRKVQQIETNQYDRGFAPCPGEFPFGLQLRPVLQQVERWFALPIQRNDLPIQNHAVDTLLRQFLDDFRKQGGVVLATSRQKAYLVVADEGQYPVAVDLRFIQP